VTTEPDNTLEVALDAVLSRYGVRLYDLNNGADRGDLASDLADVARRVLEPTPIGWGRRDTKEYGHRWLVRVSRPPTDDGFKWVKLFTDAAVAS
jgi:hypothetical protein